MSATQRSHLRIAQAFWCLLAIAIAQATFHALWFAQDQRTPFWDQFRYFEMARLAQSRMQDGAWSDLLDLHDSHPPLYSVLAGLWLSAFQETDFALARWLNILIATGTSVVIALWLRRHLPMALALGMTGACAFFPLHSSFVHLFYLEGLLTATVVSALLLLDLSHGYRRYWICLALGVVLGLGCLVKWTFPVFLIAPILLALDWRSRRSYAGLTLTVIAALAVAGPWYFHHFEGIRRFLGGGVLGGEGLLSGQFGLSAWTYYPRELIANGLGPVAAGVAILSLLVHRASDRKASLLTALQILVPIILFSCILTKKARHLLPILPLCALLIGYGLLRLKGRAQRVAVFLLVGQLFLASIHSSFGWPPGRASLLAFGQRLPLLSTSFVPGPPDARTWPFTPMIEGFAARALDAGHPAGLIAFNLPSFSEVGFRYEAWRSGRRAFIGLVAHAFFDEASAPSVFPLGPHYDEKLKERTPGLLEADFLLAKSGQSWVRYQGPRAKDAHAYGARLCEEAFDEDSGLWTAFRLVGEWRTPDGARARVLARSGADSAAARSALAKLSLRYEPDHALAFEVLGEVCPPEAEARESALVRLGAWRKERALAHAQWRAGERARARATLAELYAAHPPAEEILRDRIALADDEEARTLLRLWEFSRTEESSAEALLALADHALAHRNERHALRWLRRAAEAEAPRAALEARLSSLGKSLIADTAEAAITQIRALDASPSRR